MRVFKYSGIGGRKVNQDFLTYAIIDENNSVFIVADGMGGYSHGESAAQIAAEAVRDFVEEHYKTMSPDQLLLEATAFANDSIDIKRIALNVKQIGTVIAVTFICDKVAWLAWVGDSRIYVIRDNKPIYQTEDHSLINELRQVNTLKNTNLERYQAIVTRSLMGHNRNAKPDIQSINIKEGDVIWLCSDGFHKELPIYWLPEDDNQLKLFLDSQNDYLTDNYSVIKITF